MLADAAHNGCAEAVLIERGFSTEMLASLVSTGLAAATMDTVWVGGQMTQVGWMRITNAGRYALNT